MKEKGHKGEVAKFPDFWIKFYQNIKMLPCQIFEKNLYGIFVSLKDKKLKNQNTEHWRFC